MSDQYELVPTEYFVKGSHSGHLWLIRTSPGADSPWLVRLSLKVNYFFHPTQYVWVRHDDPGFAPENFEMEFERAVNIIPDADSKHPEE